MPEDQRFFVGQKAFIEKDGKLLLLYDPEMGYDLPGGKIQEGEIDLVKSLQREVREETGLEITVGSPFCRWIYLIPQNSGHRSAGKKIFSIGYRCMYVSGEVTLSPEHTKFIWVTRETYQSFPKNVSFQKALEEYFA